MAPFPHSVRDSVEVDSVKRLEVPPAAEDGVTEEVVVVVEGVAVDTDTEDTAELATDGGGGVGDTTVK